MLGENERAWEEETVKLFGERDASSFRVFAVQANIQYSTHSRRCVTHLKKFNSPLICFSCVGRQPTLTFFSSPMLCFAIAFNVNRLAELFHVTLGEGCRSIGSRRSGMCRRSAAVSGDGRLFLFERLMVMLAMCIKDTGIVTVRKTEPHATYVQFVFVIYSHQRDSF